MLHPKIRSFLIDCDDLPIKVISLQPHLVRRYMRRLSYQFSTHHWSVSERFPLAGAD